MRPVFRHALIAFSISVTVAAAQAPEQSLEYQVQAAYLYNFVKFVEWPSGTLGSAITICTAGSTPVATALEQIIREIDVRCEPREIPDAIDVDVSNLDVHDTLHVSDIKVAEGVEILTDAELVIATVGIVREEAAPAAAPEGEEPAEPELIGKGKKEEDGEGEGE